MSTVPLATVSCPSLADVVDDALAGALAGRGQGCVWCGAAEATIVAADIWSGQVTLRCERCGSELSGVVPHRRREVRR